MTPQRQDAPMTPEHAERIGDRFRWAAIVLALAAGAISMWHGTSELIVPGLLASAFCIFEARDHYGWRRGYLAREREELRRAASSRQVMQ